MSLTMMPERLLIGSDYLRLADAMTKDTSLGKLSFRLENPRPRDLVLVIKGESPVKEMAAAEVLRELWLYEWMPIDARLMFESEWVRCA